jgi:hypothetical protein
VQIHPVPGYLTVRGGLHKLFGFGVLPLVIKEVAGPLVQFPLLRVAAQEQPRFGDGPVQGPQLPPAAEQFQIQEGNPAEFLFRQDSNAPGGVQEAGIADYPVDIAHSIGRFFPQRGLFRGGENFFKKGGFLFFIPGKGGQVVKGTDPQLRGNFRRAFPA